MGRPLKQGLDSFPHDTDAAAEQKIDTLRTLFGNDGYAFYFILCERIYRTESAELDMSSPAMIECLARKVMVTMERFVAMLETALDLGLFSHEEYEKSGLLTSNGIKKRVSQVANRRNRWRREKRVIHKTASDPVVFQQFSGSIPHGKHTENEIDENLPKGFKEVQGLNDLKSLKDLNIKDFKSPSQNAHVHAHTKSALSPLLSTAESIQAPEPFAYEGNLDILAALNHYRISINGFLNFERIRALQGLLSDDLILAGIKESGGRSDSYCLKVLQSWSQKGWRKLEDHPKHCPNPTESGEVVAIPWRRTESQWHSKRDATASAFEEIGKRSRPGKQHYPPRE